MRRQRFAAALAIARTTVAETIAARAGNHQGPVAEAMLYATRGGKTLRGFLVLEGARMLGVAPAVAVLPAAAIECLHAYSLIHDDLPCMDDDDLRRGRPTVHRKWDPATAVLAGDALQSLAFELVALTDAPPDAVVDLVRTLAIAAGIGGMVGGQARDIAAETAGTPLTLPETEAMQAGKTGALITWAATAGAHMAQADTGPLTAYGDALGLAFQIWDDVLDIEGDAVTVGKALRKDTAAGKATFVSLLGIETAKRRAASLVDRACDSLAAYGDNAATLKEAAQFVIARRK